MIITTTEYESLKMNSLIHTFCSKNTPKRLLLLAQGIHWNCLTQFEPHQNPLDPTRIIKGRDVFSIQFQVKFHLHFKSTNEMC